jgi:Uma2 family endonuclease
MASLAKQRYTPEQYLVLEREAEFRSEYLSGEIFAMTGASPQHNRIAANVVSALTLTMRGGSCQAFVSDMRVRVRPTGLYTYPDVVTVCGRLEYDPDDCLLNPNIIRPLA